MSDDPQFPSNAQRDTTDPKAEQRVERLTSSKAIERKPPLSRRIASSFAGEDVQNVGSYVLFEVALPALKSLISDVVSQGVERFLFGGGPQHTSSGYGGSRTSYTSYNRMYRGDTRREEPRTISSRGRGAHDFREIVISSRAEADNVIETLIGLTEKYSVATVNDLYQMVGITGTFADEKWGWEDLRSAGVRRVRDGYLLELPRPIALD